MSIFDNRWFEIWSSPGAGALRPTWLYVVTPDEERPGQIQVFDPQENYRIVYQGKDYEDTLMWLTEDEYELVQGRMFPDDGFPLHTKPIADFNSRN